MQCPNCGSLLAEGSRFCPFCGSKLEAPPPRPTPTLSVPPEGRSAPGAQPPYGQQPPYPCGPVRSDPLHDPRGMKWFKFIIYFQLFANAALNLGNAVLIFTGSHYQGSADLVYRRFPALQTVDRVYGLLLLGLAALAIVARMRLARFRSNGPGFYYAVIVANAGLSLLYLMLASAASGISMAELGSLNSYAAIAVDLAMLAVNMIYFGKRKDLFVN